MRRRVYVMEALWSVLDAAEYHDSVKGKTVDDIDSKNGDDTGFCMGVGEPARPVLLDPEAGRHSHGLRRHHLPRLLVPPNRDPER